MGALNPKYLQPGTRIGFYRVLDLLGAGGLAAVYKVERDGNLYALKISAYNASDLEQHERDQLDARAKREFGALVQLHDPYIVNVHAFERFPTSDGYPYLVMEYVEGATLYDWQSDTNPSLRTIAGVVRKLAGALHKMHDHDVFHRDLKSDNVLVRQGSQDPIIIDFNIARPGSAYTLTVAGGLLGTPSHMTPEHCAWFGIQGEKPDFDFGRPQELHCVGYMLYEMLAGRPPWALGEDSFQTMGRIQRGLPTPLEEVVPPEVPPALVEVVTKLLRRDPSERFQCGEELQQSLDRILPDLPNTPYPCRSPKRRRHASTSSASTDSVSGAGSRGSSPGKAAHETKLDRPRRRRARLAPVALVALGVALAGIGSWWMLRARAEAPPRTADKETGAGEGRGPAPAAAAEPPKASPKIVLPETFVPARAPETAAPIVLAPTAPIVPAPGAAPIRLATPAQKGPAPGKNATSKETQPREAVAEKPQPTNGVLVQVTRMPAPAEPGSPGAQWGVPAGTRVATRLGADLVAVVGQRLEVVLPRPFVFGTKPVFPSRTRVTGSVAGVEGGRVSLHFQTAVLPDGRAVALDADAVASELQAGSPCELVLRASL